MCVSDRKHSIKTGRPGTGGCRSCCGFRQICHRVGLTGLKLAAEKREEKKLI